MTFQEEDIDANIFSNALATRLGPVNYRPVLGSDEALGEDEIVKRGGADMGNAVSVALNGYWGSETWDGDGSVELRERVVQSLVDPVARGEEADYEHKNDENGQGADDATEDAAALGLSSGFLRREGLVGDDVGVGEVRKAHGLNAV